MMLFKIGDVGCYTVPLFCVLVLLIVVNPIGSSDSSKF